MYDNDNMPYLDGSMNGPWDSPQALPDDLSVTLTPKEQEELDRKTEAMKREIIAKRVPDMVQKDIDKALSIVNTPEFTGRKWLVNAGDWSFSTVVHKEIGIDTDGKMCHVNVDFSIDLSFEAVTFSIRPDDYGSNGLMAALLSSMEIEPSNEVLMDHIKSLEVLFNKASEFVEVRRRLDARYVTGHVVDRMDEQLKDLLTSTRK